MVWFQLAFAAFLYHCSACMIAPITSSFQVCAICESDLEGEEEGLSPGGGGESGGVPGGISV